MSIFEEYGNETVKRVVVIADGRHNDSNSGPAPRQSNAEANSS
jgi:hypothetical protein